ncbi:MAG TPA: hypothetical protein P5523_04865 [Bacteroidales bacterium]|nr:hypothetical protein [Bacteroidales bacterium]
MKNVILSILGIFAVSIILSGCGRATASAGACASITTDISHVSLIGTWVYTSGGNTNTLVFSANCTVTSQGSGGMSAQNFVGTWGQPVLGGIPINVTATTGGAYYPPSTGSNNTGYNDNVANQLQIQFAGQVPGSAVVYVKQ